MAINNLAICFGTVNNVDGNGTTINLPISYSNYYIPFFTCDFIHYTPSPQLNSKELSSLIVKIERWTNGSYTTMSYGLNIYYLTIGY